MKVALYIRVSTQQQLDKGTPEVQRDQLRKYAEIRGFQVVKEYEDTLTGDMPLNKRPQGQALLKDAEAHLFDAVLVWKIDRFGRNALEILQGYDSLKKLGVAFISLSEAFDTSTPPGQMAFTMFAAIAEFDKAQILERTLSGRERRVRSKKYISGCVAFGYDVDLDGYLILSSRLIPKLGCTEAEATQDIFKRIAEGSTLSEECQRLNDAGVPCLSRYGAGGIVNKQTPWLVSRLSAMLRNEVYLGKFTFHSKRQTIVYDVPPLVDRNLWNLAHVQLAKNKYRRESKQRLNLLKGLIRCACGASMVAIPAYTGKPKRYYRHIYRCNASVKYYAGKNKCYAKQVPANELEY